MNARISLSLLSAVVLLAACGGEVSELQTAEDQATANAELNLKGCVQSVFGKKADGGSPFLNPGALGGLGGAFQACIKDAGVGAVPSIPGFDGGGWWAP